MSRDGCCLTKGVIYRVFRLGKFFPLVFFVFLTIEGGSKNFVGEFSQKIGEVSSRMLNFFWKEYKFPRILWFFFAIQFVQCLQHSKFQFLYPHHISSSKNFGLFHGLWLVSWRFQNNTSLLLRNEKPRCFSPL